MAFEEGMACNRGIEQPSEAGAPECDEDDNMDRTYCVLDQMVAMISEDGSKSITPSAPFGQSFGKSAGRCSWRKRRRLWEQKST
jgi:hypothetical protein